MHFLTTHNTGENPNVDRRAIIKFVKKNRFKLVCSCDLIINIRRHNLLLKEYQKLYGTYWKQTKKSFNYNN